MTLSRTPDIAVDLGASKIAVAYRAVSGIRVLRRPLPNPSDIAQLFTTLRTQISPLPLNTVLGLSRAPGLDSDGVVNSWPSRPDWLSQPILSILRNAFHTASIIDADDGACAALFEQALRPYRGRVVTLSFGTGLAVGAAERGLPIPLGEGAATLGHTPLPGYQKRCRCGRIGCLQRALAPEEALIDEVGPDALKHALAILRKSLKPDTIVLTGGRWPALARALAPTLSTIRGVEYSIVPEQSAVLGALLLKPSHVEL